MSTIQRVLRMIGLASLAILFTWSLLPAQKAGGVTAMSSGGMQAEKLGSPQTAATIIRTIVYRQISAFPSGTSFRFIRTLKMNADGSKIAFTAGDQWIYTINADGTGLKPVFDHTFPVSNLILDMSADGSKIVWTSLGQQEIYIANFDGSKLQRIATDLPGQFGGTQPNVTNFLKRPRQKNSGQKNV